MTEADAAAPDPIDVHVGKLLRAYRQAADLPLDQFCELVSVSYQQINKYERAINRISASKLVEFARALGVSPSAFFEGLEGTDPGGRSSLVSDFFSTPEAVRLSSAFLRMNSAQQQAIAKLAETMVDASPQVG